MAFKLAIVVSHPIQHFAPLHRALSARDDIEIVVLFASRIGVEPYFDREMNTTISWEMDLLGGYDYVFLPEAGGITSTNPLKVNNPSTGRELDRQNPDIVLIYGYNHVTSLRALWWCRRRGVPAMMISDSELKTQRSGNTKFVKRLLLPGLLSQFSAFLSVGDCNEAYYTHYGVDRMRLFRSPFTIDEDRYLAARRDRLRLRALLRSRLGIPEYDFVALTVGKLTPRKRPGDVIEAARKLKSADLPLSFMLVGSGEEMEKLHKYVATEDLPVWLPGFVNVDDLPAFYAASDIIVHPSSRDPHPLVMSEAASIGLPLLVSDRVGAVGKSDIAREGENAEVFPNGKCEVLTKKLASLVQDPARTRYMANRSREIYDELNMSRSVSGVIKAIQFCLH